MNEFKHCWLILLLSWGQFEKEKPQYPFSNVNWIASNIGFNNFILELHLKNKNKATKAMLFCLWQCAIVTPLKWKMNLLCFCLMHGPFKREDEERWVREHIPPYPYIYLAKLNVAHKLNTNIISSCITRRCKHNINISSPHEADVGNMLANTNIIISAHECPILLCFSSPPLCKEAYILVFKIEFHLIFPWFF